MHKPQLPELSPEASASSAQLQQIIANRINEQGGSIPFSEFMQLALYAQQFGYYTGGAHKIGASGDFITAPTLSPLFAQTLAVQLRDLLTQTAGYLYEFGAGTGALASNLLNALADDVHGYWIIELSQELAERQRDYIMQHAPKFADKVQWLTELPDTFDGILLGNEVLDAMPIERIRQTATGEFQRVHVALENQQFTWQYVPLNHAELRHFAEQYFPEPEPDGDYTSEIHPTQHAFIHTLAQKLFRGAMIWIDYGFDAKQYYHPQRTDGTLIGHHRHHSIHDPFYRVGLTDLTAHVNFSDVAEAGVSAGLDLIGYTTQAHFLFNLGILDLLATQYPHTDTAEYIQSAHAVQQLTAQHEMGELFKVMAFGKGVDVDWRGFMVGDLCHKL